MALPRLLITGASGFIGRHLLEVLKKDFEIIGLARRSQARCGAPFHENISWHMVDIGEPMQLETVFTEIQADGPVDVVIHLAAHYDFTGEDHPEYYRTNVDGLRNVLENCRRLAVKHFVFSSSLAACQFPPPGRALDEDSPPDGDHVYARTKAIGERMLAEYADAFPSVIVRFAALFSDWCEYPPLYMFLRTWLSRAWNARILGGRGQSAIPYLHITDAVSFLVRLLARIDDLDPGEVLIASPDGAVSHEELYLEATQYFFENARPPLRIPGLLAKPGIHLRSFAGRFMSEPPFERPWMARYLDKALTTDASRTRGRLGWSPRDRLAVLYRMPFLIENLRYDRIEWTHRNRDAMKQVRMRPNLKIHSLLQKHKETIAQECTHVLKARFPRYQDVPEHEHRWNHRLIMRNLFNAIRMRMKNDFMSYCRDLAERRHAQGFTCDELVGALQALNDICMRVLMEDEEAQDVRPNLPACITMTVQFGIDQVKDTYERLDAKVEAAPALRPSVGPDGSRPTSPPA
jgi:nucleoside-diphosphate-sugar epimerase